MKSKATTPRVGAPVRGSRTGRPVMVLLDLLGRRGALRLLWELRGGQPMTFRALQDAAETHPSGLNTRLAELRDAGLVDHQGEGYRLTPAGTELVLALGPLTAWAERWGAAQRRAGRAAAAG
ncbi:MAG: helix-turn-helix domain-containing protein [Rubrivivax sp.]